MVRSMTDEPAADVGRLFLSMKPIYRDRYHIRFPRVVGRNLT